MDKEAIPLTPEQRDWIFNEVISVFAGASSNFFAMRQALNANTAEDLTIGVDKGDKTTGINVQRQVEDEPETEGWVCCECQRDLYHVTEKQIAKRIFEEFINTLGGDFDMYMIYCSDYLAWLDREDK